MATAPTSSAAEVLSAYCTEYSAGTLSGRSLVSRIQRMEEHKACDLPFSLLLKRVEATCGRHFCALWKECNATCQYVAGASVDWGEDIKHYVPLPLTASVPIPPNQAGPQSTLHSRMPSDGVSQESGGFILAQKDDSVKREEQADARHAALLATMRHMNSFSLGAKADPPEVLPSKLQRRRSRTLTPPCDTPTLTDFSSVPIVDMRLPPEEVAARIGEACRHVGFFYIVNHGVPRSMVLGLLNAARWLFAQPEEVKNRINIKNSRGGARGYFAKQQENLNLTPGEREARAAYHGDLKEGFDVGQVFDPDELERFSMAGVNQWPDAEKEGSLEFRAKVEEYFSAMTALADRLMSCFALALRLETDHFIACTRRPAATLRILRYPKQESENLRNNRSSALGCGAHTDYGCCTILFQDDVGGLQVRNAKMRWVHAPPVADSFVINLGDMMSRWTNDEFSSTVHRVMTGSEKERFSIPFFFNPSFDAVIKCLPTCDKEMPRYPTATCEEILQERYAATFTHASSSQSSPSKP